MRTSDVLAIVLAVGTAFLASGCLPGRKGMRMEPMRAYVDARAKLLEAADDEEHIVRMHALEALVVVDADAVKPIIKQSLTDGTRLPLAAAAIKAAGEIRYMDVKPTCVALATDAKTNPKLLCAVLYALHRMGEDAFTSRLGALLRHNDASVRAEAAKMMGRMGERSAIGPLKSLQADEHKVSVRLNIAEALARLGDEQSLSLLEAYTKDQYIDSKLIAVEGLGLLEHPRAEYVLRKVLHNRSGEPLIRVAAAKNLARLGDDGGYRLAMDALADPERLLRKARGKRAKILPRDISALQVYAAQGLAYMDREEAVDALHPLLRSRRAPVRVASAQAIMQLLRAYKRSAPDPVAAEPKTVAEPEDSDPIVPARPRPKLHTVGGKD